MIVPLFKPLGPSTHAFVQSYGQEIDELVTHTGSLDPMAEGVVVVLTGDDRFRKEEFSNQPKVYEFTIVWGVQTDSLDLLGLITDVNQTNLSLPVIEDLLFKHMPRFVGSYAQTLPRFSARRINGESYFDKAKRGEEWDLATEDISVSSLTLTTIDLLPIQNLYRAIQEKIALVKGDFRQDAVVQSWEDTVSLLSQKNIEALPTTTHQLACSSRTYVRSLVRDLGLVLSIPACAFSIVRTQNGAFTIDQAQHLS